MAKKRKRASSVFRTPKGRKRKRGHAFRHRFKLPSGRTIYVEKHGSTARLYEWIQTAENS